MPYGYSRCVPFFFRINPGCGSEGVFPWPGCLSFSVFSRAVFRSQPVVSILCAERKIVRFRLIYRLAETECMIYGIYAGFGCVFCINIQVQGYGFASDKVFCAPLLGVFVVFLIVFSFFSCLSVGLGGRFPR